MVSSQRQDGLTVGIYAHHQGSGHIRRCSAIAKELTAHFPTSSVTIFSSAQGADVSLPLDTEEHGTYQDVTANGQWHWAPIAHEGLRERMGLIARWIDQEKPDVFYVDTSVEVSLFVRLMGIPVVSIVMPGTRQDPAHQELYRIATALVGAWPETLPVPESLLPFTNKFTAVGGLSRFSTKGLPAAQPERQSDLVVVLQGKGGTQWDDQYWQQVEKCCKHWKIVTLGGSHEVDNPFPYLQRAACVISAAGQNSVADIAAAQAPAILIPQPRAFDEQSATATSVESLDLAVVLDEMPDFSQWPQLLERVINTNPAWEQWVNPHAAEKIAQVIYQTGKEVRL